MNTENNKIIAEFMGANFNGLEFYFPEIVFKTGKNFFENHELKFHSDWNWLMEVVEKIKGLICESEFTNRIGLKLTNLNKEAVYNACVEFIKWYNEQKINP